MMIKKTNGRPPKITIGTMDKIADAIQNNYSVTDACRYAKVSRDTFYRYLNTEPLFTEKIIAAYENQSTFVLCHLCSGTYQTM
jgi:ACT domain-containing protein